MSRVIVAGALVIAVCCSARSVFGLTIQYQTVPGSTIGGEPVDARATFTTSTDTIAVKIENFQADPISPKSVVYDVLFNVSTGQNTGTITSTTGIERTIISGGTYTDTGLVSNTDWGLFTSGANLHLDRLAAPGQKKHGVIGPPNAGTNKYDAAGGALTGGPHNPFWGGSADFVLNVPGVTANSSITAISFSFDTSAGNDVPAQLVPEPAGVVLGSLGLICLTYRHGRRRERASDLT
ncbi:MAG: hypothetical protein IT427_12775 [Pirellulales bacterium]|nr:hypothetical protein [Pirellulales bacterium]